MQIYTSEVEMLRAQCREWEKVCNQHLRHIKKLKKERTWVGLTDDELEVLNDCGDTDSYQFAKAIEAAHGIKE